MSGISENEQRMYGCNIEDFRRSVEESISVKLNMGGYPMVVMSILSDAQSLMEMGRYDDARKEVNKVKWLVNEYLTPKAPAHFSAEELSESTHPEANASMPRPRVS